jgi:hypothetical protein
MKTFDAKDSMIYELKINSLNKKKLSKTVSTPVTDLKS